MAAEMLRTTVIPTAPKRQLSVVLEYRPVLYFIHVAKRIFGIKEKAFLGVAATVANE